MYSQYQGIGLAIVRQLALQYPQSPLNNGSFLIYLTARDKGRGEAALKELEQDAQLKKAKALKADGGLSEIKYHALDISDSGSIQALAQHLKQAHGDGIDFVINNAGIALDGFSMYTYSLCNINVLIPIRFGYCQENYCLQLLWNTRSMPRILATSQAFRPHCQCRKHGRFAEQVLG